MRYGKINEAIWNDDKFQNLADRSKLLFVYLLSCSNCNSVGIFQIGLGTMEDEFNHERSEIKESLAELEDAGLVRYRDKWLWFNKYLRWNEPVSPNHARQCAAFLNEVILKGAPVEAVCNFLGTVRNILSVLKIKSQDGKQRTYYDEFRAVLDTPEASNFLGGEEELRSCLTSGTCKLCPSTPKVTGSTSEVLHKPFRSTVEALGNKDNDKDKDNNNTRQDKTKQSLGLDCSDDVTTINILSSDGQLFAVGQAAVSLTVKQYPQIDMRELILSVQRDILLHEDRRPEPDQRKVDSWFLDYARDYVARGGRA